MGLGLAYLTMVAWESLSHKDGGTDTGSIGKSSRSPGGTSELGGGFVSAMAQGDERFHRRYDRWLRAVMRVAPHSEFSWNAGASAEGVAALEEWAGTLPADLRRLVLLHDGQPSEEATPMFWVNRLLSCQEIMHETDELQEINEDIGLNPGEIDGTTPVDEAAWWHRDLILFLSDDNGGGLAIDRKTGAVWDWDHDGGIFGKLAPDIGTFLDKIAGAFDAGHYTIEDAGDELWLPELDPERRKEKAAQ